jgi:capsular polysaccharide biosynthesis protein
MERLLLQQGFEPINLDHIPMLRQVELFRSAAFVVGSQGSGLSNIMFSPPGLRVLELGEGGQFHPDTWLLATKLGHLHGFLSCGASGVDGGSFSALYATMDSFRF